MNTQNEYLNPEIVLTIEDVDFYYYPLNTDYLISKNGLVYNNVTNKFLKKTICKSGEKHWYYTVTLNKKRVGLHRILAINFIKNTNNYKVTDHRDRVTTNNNLENLRWCTSSDNSKNRTKQANTTSKFIGVRKMKSGKFRAAINLKECKKHLGTFLTEIQAATAYNTIAEKYGVLHLNKIN